MHSMGLSVLSFIIILIMSFTYFMWQQIVSIFQLPVDLLIYCFSTILFFTFFLFLLFFYFLGDDLNFTINYIFFKSYFDFFFPNGDGNGYLLGLCEDEMKNVEYLIQSLVTSITFQKSRAQGPGRALARWRGLQLEKMSSGLNQFPGASVIKNHKLGWRDHILTPYYIHF